MSRKIEVSTIPPEMARQWLNENYSLNRPINPRQVERLVRFMKEGNWTFDGAPIRFDKHGNLLDGQHRLTACIEADFPFQSVIIRGLEPESFFFMDQGTTRTASNNLAILGKSNTNHLAATGSWVLRYKKKKGQLQHLIERMDVVEFASNAPKLEECVAWASRHKFGPISTSLCAAILFVFREIDDAKAFEFMGDVAMGANLAKGSPALSFRNRIIAETSGRRQLAPSVTFAFAVVAWNAFRKGRALSKLHWREDEDFPTAI